MSLSGPSRVNDAIVRIVAEGLDAGPSWAVLPKEALGGQSVNEYLLALQTPESWRAFLTAWCDAVGDTPLPAPVEAVMVSHRPLVTPILVEALQAPAEKWKLAVLAAKLLRMLRAPEAVSPLVNVVEETPEFTPLGDAAVYALMDIGEPAREALCALCERHQADVDGVPYTRAVEVLSSLPKEERTWHYLKHGLLFTRELTPFYVSVAGDYGDQRAVFHLNTMLEERDDLDERTRADCLESIALLGGIPTAQARARAVAAAAEQPDTGPFRKVGRNDPCPCGSGKKYKNCCGQ
jgi:hypothetical protein